MYLLPVDEKPTAKDGDHGVAGNSGMQPVTEWAVGSDAKRRCSAEKGDPQTVAFVLNAGDVCALGQQWSFEKELRYKEVICPQGKGWITFDTPFKKLGG
ncbi:hypothetical protein [Delftia tsuruhatensis]|uniref:hypothetical protein n=1 Tax=Delftia tsuruhatensis TaxID=180282 RepID=UPI003709F5DE